jgi:autotransporter-associated beta strand protein
LLSAKNRRRFNQKEMGMNRKRSMWHGIGVAAVAVLMTAGAASAAEYTWGGGDGPWNSVNWLPGPVAGPTSSAHSAIINSGTVKLSGSDIFGNGGSATATTAITVGSGATLDTNGTTNPIVGLTLNGGTLLLNSGFSATWGGVRLSGTLTAGGSAASFINTAGVHPDREFVGVGNNTAHNLTIAVADATGNADADLTINSKMINGNWDGNPHGLIKTGEGTLKLTAANTYTGATTIQGGLLDLAGSVTSNVTVWNNAAIGGTGTITGNLTFDAGSNLRYGASPLSVTGNVTFGGFSVSNLLGFDFASATLGSPYTLITGNNVSLTNVANYDVATAGDVGGGRKAYFQEGSMQLVVIPEPATFGLIGAAVAAMLLRRRFRKG